MVNAPIALFTFNRPDHTRRVLESLAKNPEFESSCLFVYCDGVRGRDDAAAVEATRTLVRDWPHPNKTLVEREDNWGLAASVIAGVTELCERFERVIVVEDDLVVSPVFLHYLNRALDHYENDRKVMQISAHMFPISIDSEYDAMILPFTTSWGWATWSRAWNYFDSSMLAYKRLKIDKVLRRKFDLNGAYPYFRMLKRQALGKVDSWAIRWYLSVFMCDGLVVFPRYSLVRHDGYGEMATHALRRNHTDCDALSIKRAESMPPAVFDYAIYLTVVSFIRSDRSLYSRLKRRFSVE